MISVLTGDNICEVNERLLHAVANFSKSQKKEIPMIFVIVPDRFTLQAEKILVDTNTNEQVGLVSSRGAQRRGDPVGLLDCFVPRNDRIECLLGVRVVTFSMLFNLLHGESNDKVLDKTSAVLFMWKAIQSTKEKLAYFNESADQYAFSEKMFNTINQLASCNADFTTLEKNARGDVTKRKMHDISLIYRRYKELTVGYIDAVGVLDWLIKNVGTSETIKNSHFYMTGFEYLSVQREEVMRRIIGTAKSFTIGVQKGGELEKVINEIRFAM